MPVAEQGALALAIEVDDVLDGPPRMQRQPGVVALPPVDSDACSDRQPAVWRAAVDLRATGALGRAYTRALKSIFTFMLFST